MVEDVSLRPFLSVMIPVYNAASFLPACLNSVINQQYAEMEVILINDGSTDKSVEICEEYVKNNKGFSLYHQENQGFGAARENARHRAKGDYLYFMDSDDILEPGLFRQISSTLETYKYDLVFFGFRKKYLGSSGKQVFDMVPPECNCTDPLKVIENLAILFKHGLGFGVWQQIINKDLLDRAKISFPKLKREADIAFLLELYPHVKSLITIPKVFYEYQAFYSGQKNNPEVLKNHKILFSGLRNLFRDSRSGNSIFKEVETRYFVLWFCHVVPLHIYLNPFWGIRKKNAEMRNLMQDPEIGIWLQDLSGNQKGRLLEAGSLRLMQMKNASLLYVFTAVKHFAKTNLRLNFKKIFYKQAS